VTEIFDCSRVPEGQRADIRHGTIWVKSMRQTLERLDQICTGQPGAATQGQGERAVVAAPPAKG
jgi:hypothetical protein